MNMKRQKNNKKEYKSQILQGTKEYKISELPMLPITQRFNKTFQNSNLSKSIQTQRQIQQNHFSQKEFNDVQNKSQIFNIKLIQYPQKAQGFNFQSFQQIISDLQDNQQKKQNSHNKDIENNGSKKFFECLKYNNDQKQKIDKVNFDCMTASYNNLNTWTKKKQQNFNSLDKNIKKKKIQDQTQLEQIVMKPSLNQDDMFQNIVQQEQSQLIYSFYMDLLPGPPTLQGATLTNIGNKLYIYGGKNALINKFLYELNLETWVWQRLPLTGISQQTGRLGHSAIQLNQSILIFSGENKYNPSLKIRECSSDVIIYDTQKKEWQVIKTFNAPPPRRNFASCQISNKYLMIYGGLTPYGTYLNDVSFLNLDTFVWETVDIENDIDGEKGIAFNTMCYIPKGEYKLQSLFSPLPDLRKDQIINRVKDEGVYSFGGKKSNNESTSVLKLLKIGQISLKWQILQTKGRIPMQRFNHTMNFQEITQLLIIHGGFSEISQKPLNDIHCLSLQNLVWSQVIVSGSPILQRFGHCTQVVNSCLIIFGGYDLEKHKSAQIQVLELDQLKVKLRQTQQLFNNSPLYRYQKFNQLSKKDNTNILIVDKENYQDSEQEIKSQVQQQNLNENKSFVSFQPIPQKSYLRHQSDQYFQEKY